MTKPANATTAEKKRRIHQGTSTLPSSATPEAPSSASVGASASQSTVGVSITATPRVCCPSAISGNARSEIDAGQAESTSSSATSGTTIASSKGRTSGASSRTSRPRAAWSTAEISRSMYIAASTIAAAPTTDQPQPTP